MPSDCLAIDLSAQARRVEVLLDHVRVRGLSTAELLNEVIGRRPLNNTAMHIACRKGSIAVIRSLMAAGARWDIPNPEGETALQEASHLQKSNPEVFEKIMVLMAEPMPACPYKHRCARACIYIRQ